MECQIQGQESVTKRRRTRKLQNSTLKNKDEEEAALHQMPHIDKETSNAENVSSAKELLFQKIAQDEKSVSIPLSWCRVQVFWDKQRGVTFLKRIGRKVPNNQIDSIYQKEITIDEKMTFSIIINGRLIDCLQIKAAIFQKPF